jgi:hypothetical protein
VCSETPTPAIMSTDPIVIVGSVAAVVESVA